MRPLFFDRIMPRRILITVLFLSSFLQLENDALPTGKKLKGKTSEATDDNVVDLVCKSKGSFEHLVNLCWTGENEMIAVGVNPVTLVEQLPSSLKEKRFGVS